MQPKHAVAPDGSYELWEVNGDLHREDGPAWISYQNGKIIEKGWWFKGKSHRENGPAIIKYRDGVITGEQWYFNGGRHRGNGPAWIAYEDGKIVERQWWLNGKQLSKRSFKSIEMIDQLKAYSLFTPLEVARIRKNEP